jgi:hypothetical protein
MSIRTDITTRGNPEVAIARFTARFGLARMQSVVGPALERQIKKHLLALPHNKKGWRPQNFYKQAAAATSWSRVSGGVLERIEKQGMRQRYQGGTIKPVNAESLAFPINEDAYGKVPSDFPDLFRIKGKPLLARTIGKGKNARLQVLFRLSKGVTQEGDRNVIPSREALLDEATAAILERSAS